MPISGSEHQWSVARLYPSGSSQHISQPAANATALLSPHEQLQLKFCGSRGVRRKIRERTLSTTFGFASSAIRSSATSSLSFSTASLSAVAPNCRCTASSSRMWGLALKNFAPSARNFALRLSSARAQTFVSMLTRVAYRIDSLDVSTIFDQELGGVLEAEASHP